MEHEVNLNCSEVAGEMGASVDGWVNGVGGRKEKKEGMT